MKKLDEILKKICIPGSSFPIYLFQDFDPKKKEPVEIQLCRVLEREGLIAFHDHNCESSPWKILFNIFFFKVLDLQSFSAGLFRLNPKKRKIREIQIKFRSESLKDFFTEQWNLILNHYYSSFKDNSTIFFGSPPHKIRMDYSSKKIYKNTTTYIIDQKNLVPVEKLISAGKKNKHLHQLTICKEKFSNLLKSQDCPNNLKQSEIENKFRADEIKSMIFYPSAYRYAVFFFLTINADFLKKFVETKPPDEWSYEHLFTHCGQVGPALALGPFWKSYLPKEYFIDFCECINQESMIRLLWDFFEDILQNNVRLDLEKKIFPSWRGMPDLIVFDNSEREHILLECKTRYDKFQESQKEWFKKNYEYYGFNAALVLTSEKSISKYREFIEQN